MAIAVSRATRGVFCVGTVAVGMATRGLFCGTPSTSSAGLRLGQLDGTWITGGISGTGSGDLGGGLSLGNLDGTWIGATRKISGGFSLNQLMGVWVDAGSSSVITTTTTVVVEEKSVSGTLRKAKAKITRPILQLNQPLREDKTLFAQLHREDEEIISVVVALIQLGIIK